MENFIIPESVKILESKLKAISNSIIPAFNISNAECDGDGAIEVPSKYETETTQGDFLLFVGVDKLNEDVEGFASACVVGEC
jgi:hypothetical protein